MQIASWNVNGLRAVARKDLLPWTQLADVDVWCLQETKAKPEQIADVPLPPGWHASWHSAERPGYSGVALLSRSRPDEVITGMGDAAYDCEGRVLSARFGRVAVVSAYFPNSQELGARLDYKLGFCAAMERHLKRLRAGGGEVVLLGDYNIAHQPIDLARPEDNEESPGYLPEERAWFTRFLGLGYRDIFRERHPGEAEHYSWWSYRGGARARNVGWRIDYACTSPGLAAQVADIRIHPGILGSDHCPVSIRLA